MLRTLGTSTLLAAALVAIGGDARGADAALALGEIQVPVAAPGLDRATVKAAALQELGRIDEKRLPKRKVVVALAVVRATDAPVACTVNAMLRDGRTGTMIAILEGRARAEGGADAELRRRVVGAAVTSALAHIPEALASK